MSAILQAGVSKVSYRSAALFVMSGAQACLTVHTTPAQGSEEDQERQGPSHSCSSGLGEESLVSRASEKEH